jgi:hypothetical protein
MSKRFPTFPPSVGRDTYCMPFLLAAKAPLLTLQIATLAELHNFLVLISHASSSHRNPHCPRPVKLSLVAPTRIHEGGVGRTAISDDNKTIKMHSLGIVSFYRLSSWVSYFSLESRKKIHHIFEALSTTYTSINFDSKPHSHCRETRTSRSHYIGPHCLFPSDI